VIVPLALFWIPTLLVAWAYVGYPALAFMASRVRPFRMAPADSGPRRVTVGIAAYNEGARLEARIADTFAQVVPFELEVIVGSDGSSDDTVAFVGRLAVRDPRIRVLDLPRAGQTATQGEIFNAATGEVVVLTDAETRFEPGCLDALVAPFADPRVGCTTGQIRWIDATRTETSRNEGAYWRYEQVVRRLESRAGWLTAVTGAILAVRRSAFRPVPAHASMDHLLPLYAREARLIVLAVPEAVATDRGIAGIRDQLRNRSRTATRGIRSNLSMAGQLAPWRRPTAALAIWSHKLLRWATPWLGGLAAIGAIWLGIAGSPAYLVAVAIGVVVLLLAAAGWLLRARGRRLPRLLSLPLSVTIVNAAFLTGWVNVVRGRRIDRWEGTSWATVPGGGQRDDPRAS
jgi:cellulose synthase/poly-beta-1,6-N-acetylglucosamine synthase-like glycosyltransferase